VIRLSFLFLFFTLLSPAITFSSDYAVDKINPDLLENANAVVREDVMTLTVHSESSATMVFKYAITILNANAKKKAKFYISYDKLSRINNVQGRILDAGGDEIKKLKRSQIEDISLYDGYSLYTDNRAKVANLTYPGYPYTVEIEYEKEYNGLLWFPSWYAVGASKVSVESSKYKIVSPQSIPIRYQTVNIGEPETYHSAGNIFYTWQVENLKAKDREPYGPSIVEIVPHVYVAPKSFEIEGYRGSMDTWEDFARWYHKLNKGRDELSQETIEKVRALVKDKKNNEEKIASIYKHIQENTRYVSIQLGIGGWQTFPASTVESKGYGDCKALTNFTKSLLKNAGITSHYALVRAGKHASKLRSDFPSSQFNHVFLCVPNGGDTLWLECTSQNNPFGYLGTFTSDRDVLLVTEQGGKVVHTPVYPQSLNLEQRVAKIKLDDNGNGIAEIQTQYEGLKYEENNLHFIIHKSGDEQKKWLYRHLPMANYEIEDYHFTEKSATVPAIYQNLRLSLPKYASISGKRLFLPLNLANHDNDVPPKVNERSTKVILKRAYVDIDSIQYQLPEGYYLEYIPELNDLYSAFGDYEVRVEENDQGILYVRKLKMNKGEFSPEEYEKFRQFMKEIHIQDNKKVVFINKT